MKEFFKYALATVCGIIALGIVAGIIMMISFAGIVASGNATTEIKENSVLVFKLNGTVNERTEEGTPFDALLGTADMSSMGLDDILAAIKKAKNNEDIIALATLLGRTPRVYILRAAPPFSTLPPQPSRFAMPWRISRRVANGLSPMPTSICRPATT